VQWWENLADKKIEPHAALYELARRHPLIAQTSPDRIQLPGSLPLIPLPPFLGPKPSLRVTRCLAMKSWPKLTNKEKEDWKSNIGKVKGFDLRPAKSLCINVVELARLAVWQARSEAAKFLSGTEYPARGLGWYPTDGEYEVAVAKQAVEAFRKGYMILGVAPDLRQNKAESVLMEIYRKHSLSNPSCKRSQRARWQDWLPCILRFENAETSRDKAKSQEFAHYRRLVDGIQFA
jgi:hypothetical protein